MQRPRPADGLLPPEAIVLLLDGFSLVGYKLGDEYNIAVPNHEQLLKGKNEREVSVKKAALLFIWPQQETITYLWQYDSNRSV